MFRFAQKALIVDKGRVLLVQKSDGDPDNAGKWELPGGRLEPGESLESGLRREVLEEVGLHVDVLDPLALWSWTMKRSDTEITVVAAARLCALTSNAEIDTTRQVDDDYIGGAMWVALNDVLALDLIEDARPAIERCLANPLVRVAYRNSPGGE